MCSPVSERETRTAGSALERRLRPSTSLESGKEDNVELEETGREEEEWQRTSEDRWSS